MAVRKAGMRRIAVDGVEYLWKFPRRPSRSDWDCWGGCAAMVQRSDGGRSTLLVTFAQHHPAVAKVAGFPVVSVVPSQIADAIRRAIAAGWEPDEAGPQFAIAGVEADA